MGGIAAGTADDTTPRLSDDELTLYFASNRDGQTKLYVAQRTSRSEDFGQPSLISELALDAPAQCPSLTRDQLTMYFEDSQGGYQIFRTNRSSLSSSWSMPTVVASISGAFAAVGGPWITPSGDLYFHAFQTSDLDVFVARRGIDDFETPQPVLDIDTHYVEQRPVLSVDELTMFFASNRPDGGAIGSFDIWVTTRRSRDDSFGAPTNVHELNTAAFETPGWLSTDGCRIYFDRSDSVSRIHFAERPVLAAAPP